LVGYAWNNCYLDLDMFVWELWLLFVFFK
jgi:hypothetical protein